MTDINAPTNQQIASAEGKTGHGKIVAGIIASGLTNYVMNQASLHGINFELIGISSEVVKATIDGTLVGVIVGLTPSHFVAALCDAKVFIKTSLKQFREAGNTN